MAMTVDAAPAAVPERPDSARAIAMLAQLCRRFAGAGLP